MACGCGSGHLITCFCHLKLAVGLVKTWFGHSQPFLAGEEPSCFMLLLLVTAWMALLLAAEEMDGSP